MDGTPYLFPIRVPRQSGMKHFLLLASHTGSSDLVVNIDSIDNGIILIK